CMVVWGSPSDYDEWGDEWSFAPFATYLDRATTCMRTTGANTDRPAPPHDAFIEAAEQAGFPLRDAPNDPAHPVGVARLPANVVDGVRWSGAFSYLEEARGRGNLTVLGETLVDRLVLDGGRKANRGDHGGARRRRVLQPGDPHAKRHRAAERLAKARRGTGSRPPRR